MIFNPLCFVVVLLKDFNRDVADLLGANHGPESSRNTIRGQEGCYPLARLSIMSDLKSSGLI